MRSQKHTNERSALWSRLYGLMLLTVTLSCAVLLTTDQANALYILTGGKTTAMVVEDAQLRKAADYSSRLIYAGSRTQGYDLTVETGRSVKIRCGGTVAETVSQGESISALLERLNAVPGPMDMVLVDVSGEAVELTVGSELSYYERRTETVAYNTVRTPTADLPKGTEKVVQAGKDGVRTAIYEVTYSGGELSSRQLVGEEDSTMVTEEILVGTGSVDVGTGDRLVRVENHGDGSGTLVFQSGTTLNFSSVRSMTATAYTAGYGGADYCTATGTMVRVGVVAVDKKVIPLGTRMYIQTPDGSIVYGVAVAEDTGVRGNKVDLYYPTYNECINFGRRTCDVYILE